jgi:hypothetical protein
MTRAESNTSLERFIRGELGCQCPAEVFQEIVTERCPAVFGNWSGGALVRVGKRLLILVLQCDDCTAMQRSLPSLVEAGRHMRDARGFNRFRLVVGTSRPDAMASYLMPGFEHLEEKDDRLHLHVVAAGRLPALKADCGSNGRGG